MAKDTVVLYVHGKGGNAAESERFRPLFPQADVIGFDYRSENPWDAKTEFSGKTADLKAARKNIVLIARSIGAYFAMNAGISDLIGQACFISPIVDMESLIATMLARIGASESELESRKIIKTDFGQDLSWDYLQYVRNNPIEWNAPTRILYGDRDNLQSRETIAGFARRVRADVTVMNGGEHWFHTPEQMDFLDDWIRKINPVSNK